MKIIIISALLVLAIVASASSIVWATNYYYSYTADYSASFSLNPSGTPVTAIYHVGGWWADAEAETTVSVPIDGTGYAWTRITAANNHISSHSGSTVVSGFVHSGFASVSGQDKAKRIDSYGKRKISGNTDSWSIDFN